VVLKNVRQFRSASFELKSGFNLLIGENGAGKTTVLHSLLAVAGARKFCSKANLGFEIDDIKLGESSLKVEAYIIGAKGEHRSLTYTRNTSGKIRRTGDKSDITLLFYQSNEALTKSLKPKKGRRIGQHEPLRSSEIEEFLYSTQQRKNLDIEPGQRFGRSNEIKEFVAKALSKLSPTFTDFGWRFEAIDCRLRSLKENIEPNPEIKKTLSIMSGLLLRSLRKNPKIFADIDQQKITINSDGNLIGSGSPAVSITEPFNRIFEGAGMSSLPRGMFSIESIVAEVDLAPRIVVIASNGGLPLEQLSDGEKRLFSLFVDIARILSLNSAEKISEATSIVLIDEIDVHLHPRWQRSVGPSLEELFPTCQFIASTHSPFIIQSADNQNVLKIFLNGGERVDTTDVESIEDIVEEVQEIPMPQRGWRAEELHKAAKRYFSLLQEDDSDPEDLRAAELDYRKASEPYSSNPAVNALLQIEKQKVREQ